MHFAALLDEGQLVDKFLKLGATITVQDKEGNTPLHLAVYGGTVLGPVRLLLRSSAASLINSKNFNYETPLDIAIKRGNKVMEEFLINFVDFHGKTALDYAIASRNKERALFLLGRGAKINVRDSNDKTFLSHLESTAAKHSISPTIIDALRKSMEFIPSTSNESISHKVSHNRSQKERKNNVIVPREGI